MGAATSIPLAAFSTRCWSGTPRFAAGPLRQSLCGTCGSGPPSGRASARDPGGARRRGRARAREGSRGAGLHRGPISPARWIRRSRRRARPLRPSSVPPSVDGLGAATSPPPAVDPGSLRRRAAVREHERRSGERILLGRHPRGDHRTALQDSRAEGDRENTRRGTHRHSIRTSQPSDLHLRSALTRRRSGVRAPQRPPIDLHVCSRGPSNNSPPVSLILGG